MLLCRINSSISISTSLITSSRNEARKKREPRNSWNKLSFEILYFIPFILDLGYFHKIFVNCFVSMAIEMDDDDDRRLYLLLSFKRFDAVILLKTVDLTKSAWDLQKKGGKELHHHLITFILLAWRNKPLKYRFSWQNFNKNE